MASQVRCSTLAQLAEGYKSGAYTAPLMLDNDSTTVYQESAPGADDHECVFEMHPEDLLEQALDMLGVPHGHV
jgi:hypothetical protein